MESDWPKRNKSHYVTKIVSWLGFTDVIFDGDKRQPEIRLRSRARLQTQASKCRKWTIRLTESDRVQSGCYSLLETWHSCTVRFCQLMVFALVNNNFWSHVRIEIPYPAQFPLQIPHPNPIKTRNPAPARNCKSRFPPLFSAQIPNITAKKGQIPHPAKPIGNPRS